MDLPETERMQIIELCRRHRAKKVILFGSRATGKNTAVSDIDLAVSGAECFDELFADLKYNDFTLLDIDVVNLEDRLSRELTEDIARDGVILYEESAYEP